MQMTGLAQRNALELKRQAVTFGSPSLQTKTLCNLSTLAKLTQVKRQ